MGVPRSTFDTWVRGYLRRSASGKLVQGNALLTSVPGKRLTIPFIGLAEGMVLAAFRETGLPLQRIRPALERLDKEMGLEHALASKHLYTDGAELLFDYAENRATSNFVCSLSSAQVSRCSTTSSTSISSGSNTKVVGRRDSTLPITEEPVLMADPERSFGQAIFVHGAARFADVIGRIEAGEDERVVAEDYGVPLADIHAAVAAPVQSSSLSSSPIAASGATSCPWRCGSSDSWSTRWPRCIPMAKTRASPTRAGSKKPMEPAGSR